MSILQTIRNLDTRLENEIRNNSDEHDDSIAFLNRILANKHETNSDLLRLQILVDRRENDTIIRQNLREYSNQITNYQFESDSVLKRTKEKSEALKSKRLSVDFQDSTEYDRIDQITQSDEESDENLSQLRRRLLEGNKSQGPHDNAVTFEEHLQYEEEKQENLLRNMSQFIQGIKEGATAFNEKLNEDSNVLQAAEAGLDVTSKKLSTTKENLSKTISNLSLWDSLKIFGLVIILFFLSLIVIQIFPKW